MQRPLPWLTLLTGSLVMVALGSLHAFSVFLQPLEKVFETERASVALVYSLALISLTVLAVTAYFGVARAAQVYGRVFTSWGVGGSGRTVGRRRRV